jgi:hypothetical protein
VDPLADYNPVMNDEHYVDGEHNGGIENSFNHASYSYCYQNPVRYEDPNGKQNVVAALGGALLGGIIGGGIEATRQYLKYGEVRNWKAVQGSTIQGAIVGGVAGFTNGASLLVTATSNGAVILAADAGLAAGANIIGGTASRIIQGEKTTVSDVAFDGTVGAAFSVVGTGVSKVLKGSLDKLSNNLKGKLGEGITKLKYNLQGFKSNGKAVVETGRLTPTGRVQVAKYDFEFERLFTGKKLTVESKFNTSGYTSNQIAAEPFITTPGRLILDKTTSQQIGNVVKSVITGTAGQVHKKR